VSQGQDRAHDRYEHEAGAAEGVASDSLGTPDRRLIVSLILNFLITIMQLVGGLIANSLGLLSDAAHNLSDVVALGLSLWAVRLGRRTATHRHTFAYKRAEILVALFNSAALIAISVYIIVEAAKRMANPTAVDGLWVMAFAAGGLLINGLAALLLRSHGHDLNLRSAFLHLIGDAFTSLGVMASGLIVYLWGWNYADAIISILVSLWIGREAFAIVKSTVNVLMEGTPEGVEYKAVETTVAAMPGVNGIHDLHIWSLSSNDTALSAHVVVDDAALSRTTALLAAIKDLLAHEFGIGHATLELETEDGECAGSSCAVPAKNLGSQRRPSGHSHAGHQH
jgi:cobalt-zinc-cadmium efflux system protein